MTWRLAAVALLAACAGPLAAGGSSGRPGAPAMQIEIETDGGFAAFPGLARPRVLDSTALSPVQQAELSQLVDAAFAEQAVHGAPQSAPVADGRRYHIRVEQAGTRRQLEAADPQVPPAFAALKELLGRLAR